MPAATKASELLVRLLAGDGDAWNAIVGQDLMTVLKLLEPIALELTDLTARNSELAAECERLRLQIECAKVAAGWHPDDERSIADEVSYLRDKTRGTTESDLIAKLDKANHDNAAAFDLVSRIRFALGDNGKRMLPEFLEYCKLLVTELAAGRDKMDADIILKYEAKMSLADEVDSWNLSEREREILRRKWLVPDNYDYHEEQEDKKRNQRYVIYFPKETGFEQIELRGHVPARGDRVSIRTHLYPNVLPGYDHCRDYRSWYVKNVWWSVRAQCTKKDRTIYDNSVDAEVRLDYDRWRYRWFMFMLKFYYDPRNKIRNWWWARKRAKKAVS